MQIRIKSVLCFLRDIIISPKSTLRVIMTGERDPEVAALFILASAVTFAKGFRMSHQEIRVFQVGWVDKLLTMLTIPHVKWVVVNLVYLLFVGVIYLFGRHELKERKKMRIFFCFASISGFGLIAQAVFFVLQFGTASVGTLRWLSYIVFFWACVLTVTAIMESLSVGPRKAITIFLGVGMIVVFLGGLPAICPSLLWLCK